MSVRVAVAGVLAGLLSTMPGPSVGADPNPLPAGFARRAMEHVEALVASGPRPAGRRNEAQAARYIAGQLERMGLAAEIERFSFESFEVAEVRIAVDGEPLQPVGLGMDPYQTSLSYEGPYLVLDPREPTSWPESASIAGRVVVTARTDDASLHFRLAASGPRFVVYLSPSAFLAIRDFKGHALSIEVEGSLEKGSSANVVAHLGAPPPAPQVLIGAHMDAYRDCPGANDNASGIGALLELARHFKSLGKPSGIGISFVAFGAEELGVLGSRRYVAAHAQDLEHLVLVLAMDNLGGAGPVAVERNGGESDLPTEITLDTIPGPYRRRAFEGRSFPWVLLPAPDTGLLAALARSYRPAWLAESIDDAVEALGFEVRLTGVQGTDQMPFAAAGIPTSAVSAVNRVAHTAGDDARSVRWDSLASCATVVARIVSKVMDRCAVAAEAPAASPCGR